MLFRSAVPFETRAVDLPIGRVDGTWGVAPDGKEAQTWIRREDVADGRSRLILEPRTGRTHQLRVHCAALGHPIVGDADRGGGTGRLHLHHERLVFRHPVGGAEVVCATPAPPGVDWITG